MNTNYDLHFSYVYQKGYESYSIVSIFFSCIKMVTRVTVGVIDLDSIPMSHLKHVAFQLQLLQTINFLPIYLLKVCTTGVPRVVDHFIATNFSNKGYKCYMYMCEGNINSRFVVSSLVNLLCLEETTEEVHYMKVTLFYERHW